MKVFIFTFIIFILGWWSSYIHNYLYEKYKERIKKNKNYTFVVIVCCQGNSTEYEYSNLFSALVGYTKEYLRYSKYGTMNFTLKQKFK